jgi:hypothetical protein
MEEASTANPFLVALFFIARCLVPLLVMLGITYLLKRLGLITEPPKPPSEWNNNESSNYSDNGAEGNAHAES